MCCGPLRGSEQSIRSCSKIMDYFFIINPGSRHRGGARFIPALLKTLQIRRIDFDFRITETMQDACRFSREANLKGAAVVVAVGGDGTINQVINGFYDDDGKRISSSKLGVIHTGTSPDFCRSYGIPTQPELALEALLRGFTQEVSVARIEYHDQSGSSRRGYFACCASFGLGAQVARAANSGRVVLAANLYYSGNTVIIDHGLGVFTYYGHFSKILVKVGSTGRSTGPHLHWSVRVLDSRVDPFSLAALPLE